MDKRFSSALADIRKKLDTIEDYMIWLIKPDIRFWIGQRVEWSRRARKRGFPSRKCAQRGVVNKIEDFTIVVQMDGLKHPGRYHHAFFNPAAGPKLF